MGYCHLEVAIQGMSGYKGLRGQRHEKNLLQKQDKTSSSIPTTPPPHPESPQTPDIVMCFVGFPSGRGTEHVASGLFIRSKELVSGQVSQGTLD